ncbi:fungal-specific transcription factor domain-containing protein [Rhodocollybia butyracea]|uniref:Fungal-specific transcription factor domain-containing protein n=1 Tax=Rhodocollybia butyracea TaxID=206335 RepID=A0A9P5PSY3_9AGAR|nr:fungal-specific transcription factor domain-containing protein [Rhodocollybia butyracea]
MMQASQPPKSQVISCAECRRLKLKCDRVFPCAACIRRGCGNLCPNGTLEKGKRGFLKRLEQALPSTNNYEDGESTEVAVFMSRDAAMAKRIHELETALIEAGIEVPGLPVKGRSKSSNKRVRARSTSRDFPSREETKDVSTSSEEPEMLDLATGFGTLTIDPKKRSRYIGLSGGSAYLDSNLWGSRGREHESFSSASEDQLERDLEAQVVATLSAFPPYEEAIRLSNNYFRHVSYLYEVIPERTFLSTHLPALYHESAESLGTPDLQNTVALVGTILALGQFFDLEQPRSSVEPRSGELFRLAAFALNSRSILDGGLKINTLQGVQALHLMSFYTMCKREEERAENAWHLLGLAVRSVQAQGIHMDPSRWNLPEKELEERRRVFWEVLSFDRLAAFTTGRPHALSDIHYDCKMPMSSDIPLPSDNDPANSTWSHTRWHTYKFHFAKLIGRIIDDVYPARPTTYTSVMEYDREINDFYLSLPQWTRSTYLTQPVESSLWEKLFPQGADGMVGYDSYKEGGFKGMGKPEHQRQNLQINSLATMIFVVTLHLHRGPFCRALCMEPKEMLKSQYEMSISRVVSSSTAVINVCRGMFVLHPVLTSRLWHWVFHTFSAAVCLAVFVIVAPFHHLSPHAFRSLQDAFGFLKLTDGRQARTAALRLTQLVENATRSMTAFCDAAALQQDGIPAIRAIKKMPRHSSGTSEVVAPSPSNMGHPRDLLGLRRNWFKPHPADVASSEQLKPPVPSSEPSTKEHFARMMGIYVDSSGKSMRLEPPFAEGPRPEVSDQTLSILNSWITGVSSNVAVECSHNELQADATRNSLSNSSLNPRPGFGWEYSGESNSHNEDHMTTGIDGVPSYPFGFDVGSVEEGSGGSGNMHPGPHFNDNHAFNLSSFIQDGAKAWTYDL